MLPVFLVLFCYSLLTFGGVLANSWFLLKILWLIGVAGCCIIETFRERRLSSHLLILFVLSALLFQFTQAKLSVGLMAAAWAWVAARKNTDTQILRFLHILLVIGVLEALLGLFQFFVSPGWIFGYTNPFYRASGTLINRNHFAGLLEMLVPIAIGFSYVSLRKHGDHARAYTYVLTGAFIGLALIFSVSRMGIFSFFVTTFFLLLLIRVRHSNERFAAGIGLGVIALVIVGAMWIGLDVITARYAELGGEEGIIREGRVIVYRDTIRMIVANPGGVGTGQYQDRFREYQTVILDRLLDHAHNDFLETTAEWGTLPASVFWIFIIFVLISAIRTFWGPSPPEKRGILLACLGAIFSILLHSLTDFNLQIPSNAMLFFTFLGLAGAYSFPPSRISLREEALGEENV